MARGRNSKAAVLRDNARERKQQEHDATALETAAAVIRQRFTGEGELTGELGFLAGKIRDGVADHTDHLVRDRSRLANDGRRS
jgi:hypothetical protein